MMVLPCMACFTAVRVMEVLPHVGPESEFWPAGYTCVACGNPVTAIGERETELVALEKMKLRDLTSDELYAALHGLGTPEERVAHFTSVNDLLLSKKVTKVIGHTVGNTDRTVIEALELEDGTRMYLGSGSAGAIVYRITHPVSYTQKALDHG